MASLPDLGDIRFLKLRDAGSVLNATLAFLRRNAKELITAYAALVVPVALATGVASALFFSRMSEVILDPGALANGSMADLFGLNYLIAVVLSLLATAVSQAGAGGFVRLYREGEAGDITVGRLWNESARFVLPLIGMMILFFLAVAVSSIVSIVPCLGALAWMAFVVWALPYYGVATSARMMGASSVAEAVREARDLVKGSWGFVAGAYLLAGLVAFVLFIAAYLVMSAVMGIALANSAVDDPTAIMRAFGWVMAPFQVVTYVIYLVPTLAAFFIYGRLAEELEGTSLHDDLDVLAGSAFERAAMPEPDASTPPPPPRRDAGPTQPSPDADRGGEGPPPPNGDRPPDDAPGGFRGGGFGS